MASPDINTEDFQAAVDYLSLREDVDSEKIGIIGICGWGSLALNTAALDTRIKVTVASTMYDMARINAKGYFDAEDSEAARYEKKKALNTQRIADYKRGSYALGGGVVDPLPVDAPFFVNDYYDYYKTKRGYHPRSLNSNGGWNVIGCMSFLNQPIICYSNEIRSAVLVMHGEKAHSCYMGRDTFAHMMEGNPNPENKELLITPARSTPTCTTAAARTPSLSTSWRAFSRPTSNDLFSHKGSFFRGSSRLYGGGTFRYFNAQRKYPQGYATSVRW